MSSDVWIVPEVKWAVSGTSRNASTCYTNMHTPLLCVCVDTGMERGRINEYFCAFSNKPTSIPELRRLNRGLRHGGDD